MSGFAKHKLFFKCHKLVKTDKRGSPQPILGSWRDRQGVTRLIGRISGSNEGLHNVITGVVVARYDQGRAEFCAR